MLPPDESQRDGCQTSTFKRSAVFMDTAITIEIVDPPPDARVWEATAKAFDWFRHVEMTCSRFDGGSELSRLSARPGVPVEVSPLLFEVLQFALAVAATTGGVFEPTVGRALEVAGFDRNYRTGERAGHDAVGQSSFRDVVLDAGRRTVMLRCPLVLDLGAVAKGFAIDLAVREIERFEHFSVNVGGDMFLGGCNAEGEPWRVGIPHPRIAGALCDSLRVHGAAVCTSTSALVPPDAGTTSSLREAEISQPTSQASR